MMIAFKDIKFKFDDEGFGGSQPSNGNNKQLPSSEEDNFRKNFPKEKLNTSTPKKNAKSAISDARSNFFGQMGDGEQHQHVQRDASSIDQNDTTAGLLTDCTVDSCDINNNSDSSKKPEVESGLGSELDEPDRKYNSSGERDVLLANQGEEDSDDLLKNKRNVILATSSARESVVYDLEANGNPSQAVYMATTVPQNIKGGNKIMGRHTPTRNSLRHSRMLVINKNFQGALNPLNIFHPKWAKFCLAMHVLMGLGATAIGLWLLLWAPHTRVQDNPYWSGLILILCGSMGVVVLEFKRIPRNKSRELCFRFLKFNFLFVLLLAMIASLAAFVFAAIHCASLFAINTFCVPAHLFTTSSTCVCVFGKPVVVASELEIDKSFLETSNNTNAASDRKIFNNISGSHFHYKDLNCNEVTGPWKYILLASSITNMIGFATTLAFLILYFRGTRQVNLYASVRQPNTVT